jgi:hypothetical protein
MHRTGATHAYAASEFRAGEADYIADHPQQRRVVLDINRDRPAIDLK